MSQKIAKRLGKQIKVTTTRIVNTVKSTVLDFYSTEIQFVRYDTLKIKLYGEIKREISDFVSGIVNILTGELNLGLNYTDFEYVSSYALVISDITSGEIFWRIFNHGINLQRIPDKRKRIMNTIDFFDSTVYNILMDGLYKLVRNIVYQKLTELGQDINVRWYSMNGEFKHPICKERAQIIVNINDVEKRFKELHEKRYNWLHPHFLCDGIFLPVR